MKNSKRGATLTLQTILNQYKKSSHIRMRIIFKNKMTNMFSSTPHFVIFFVTIKRFDYLKNGIESGGK